MEKGDVIADGMSTQGGELALGRNLLVAFMPWRGYNFEDAILISEKISKEDIFTSIHVEEFQIEATETRLGNEEITRDIPNISEESLKDLDKDGLSALGPRCIRERYWWAGSLPRRSRSFPRRSACFGRYSGKGWDVRDTSLVASPGVEGVVVDVHVFQRKDRGRKSKDEKKQEASKIREIKAYYKQEITFVEEEKVIRLSKLLGVDRDKLDKVDYSSNEEARVLADSFEDQIKELLAEQEQELEKVRRAMSPRRGPEAGSGLCGY